MTRTIATLLAAATIAGVAMPAAAQTKYYARERIVGVSASSAPTFKPVYSTTFGSCVGGSRSKQIVSCVDAAGVETQISNCSSQPQSIEAESCVNPATCNIPSVGRWTTGAGTGSQLPLGNAANATTARNMCNASATPPSTTSVCTWHSETKLVQLFTISQQTTASGRSDLFSSTCQ